MAILRARGGSPTIGCPPMKTSPDVGCSRPAMSRRSVVLPQPDGPSRTRYSPSVVARSRSSTAALALPSNALVRWRTSTIAMRRGRLPAAHQASLAPALEDRPYLVLGVDDRVLRAQLAPCRLRHHLGKDEGVEDLTD